MIFVERHETTNHRDFFETLKIQIPSLIKRIILYHDFSRTTFKFVFQHKWINNLQKLLLDFEKQSSLPTWNWTTFGICPKSSFELISKRWRFQFLSGISSIIVVFQHEFTLFFRKKVYVKINEIFSSINTFFHYIIRKMCKNL